MVTGKLPPFIEYLLQPAAYPHAVEDVRLIQTHISYVLLAGDFVYKFKKPLDFGFLNFSTLKKRKYFCRQELILNRRLCPTIYLDLVRVTRSVVKGKLELDGPGQPIEYGIKMVRLPEAGMMGNIIKAGKLSRPMIDDIVSVLGPFYELAFSDPAVEKFGTVHAIAANVNENLAHCEQFVGCPSLSRSEYDAIAGYVRRFLARKEVFANRRETGRIKDCHGDLHSANICLADKVYIYDCIEFNHRFRYSDVASDIAFLAMDLDYYGLEEMSEYFVQRFQSLSGDWGLREVLNFYKCYRAAVRGKIGLLTAHESEVDDDTRAQALVQATKYFVLAQRYAEST
jgi:hypothetical protein